MSVTSTSKVSGTNSSRAGNTRNTRVGNRRNEDIESVETADAVSGTVGIQKENEQSFDNFHKERQKKQETTEESINYHPPINAVSITTLEVLETIEEPETTNSSASQVNVYGANQRIIRKERNPNDNYAKHFYEKNEIIEEVDEFA
ncbi:MAG: hypothetical protein ACK5N8_03830 [Alphaproteobacteria bacterium]